MRRYLVVAALLSLVWGSLASVFFGEAEAHRTQVTLHNSNDAGLVSASHHRLTACDGTNNGHRFALQGEKRGGGVATVFDFGSSSQCHSTHFGAEIARIRWACHGEVGEWKRT